MGKISNISAADTHSFTSRLTGYSGCDCMFTWKSEL